MSLFIISSDWRFKEHFKHHFTQDFLHEFTISHKLLEALDSSSVSPKLLIIDERMSKGSQRSVLEQLTYQKCTIPILLFTSNEQQLDIQNYKTLNLHVIKRKGVDFESLFSHLDPFLGKSESREQQKPYIPCGLVGNSYCMQRLRNDLSRYAKQNCSIHLYGETGTGKELAATYLHRLSFPHRNMVSVNCSLLSSSLGNSMFFGHVKGAFTDGNTDLPGLVHEANQSTLFLDELETLSPSFQAYMLRLLENGQYRRLGDTQLYTSRFRLITASNEDLVTLMQGNRIRKDFFYRINEVSITLPPLRDHLEDIPQLSDHFLLHCKSKKQLDEHGLELLMSYHWPGNVRQLFSTIRRCLINSEDEPVVLVKHDDIYQD
ncbi:sigma 54-interacting transcriptional regulator [uncultured Sphaerochaeta sp.]|uniref:sigma-54-dependent transcriptional regulator n=1 Tax=uncultured Sphaerochaeta sp. TaxID=886478 RepID=UPI002A0A53B7|nr:sigma 54-interacting transcriptional regulator [uncultured Sphaerochaeta sp.]